MIISEYEKLLNTPFYALDFRFMVSDLIDFLRFSESNINWQKHAELQSVARKFQRNEINDEERYHLTENVEHRFNVSLVIQLRYAALISLVTSVEWAISCIVSQMIQQPPKQPEKKNKTVFIMEHINRISGLSKEEQIRSFEDLVKVRNAIAHSSGLEAYAKYPEELAEAVNRLFGFSLDNWHFLGKHVCIAEGAIEHYANEIEEAIVQMHIALNEQKKMNKK